MIAENQTFKNMTIYLDGGTFVGCIFERCHFVLCAAIPFRLERNTITSCTWEMAGHAKSTINLLSLLYKVSPELIESTFENIRNGAVGHRRGSDPVVLN